MDQMLHVSSNPHVRDKMTTSKIMQLVVLALLPTTLFGIYNFRPSCLTGSSDHRRFQCIL